LDRAALFTTENALAPVTLTALDIGVVFNIRANYMPDGYA